MCLLQFACGLKERVQTAESEERTESECVQVKQLNFSTTKTANGLLASVKCTKGGTNKRKSNHKVKNICSKTYPLEFPCDWH